MDPLTIGLMAGGGLGLVKGILDQGREAKDRQVAAETTRYSPWTHMQAQPVQRADLLGSAMQGGTAGAMMGQGYQNMQNQQGLVDAQTGYYNAAARGAAGAAPPAPAPGGNLASAWLFNGNGYPGASGYPQQY